MSVDISKVHRDELLEDIEELRHFLMDNSPNQKLIRCINEIGAELTSKKYGLIFERHREKIDDLLLTHMPVLTEKVDKTIRNGGTQNFLIEGDNLPALNILLKTHRGKVALAYIDPPYNTLNEGFTYSDKMVDSNDTFRHSKWLSFMDNRLRIAQQLLSPKGSIFISIDDNEVGTLRLLCDDIFGAQNFVANIIWEKKFSPQNDARWLSDTHDHILVYAKNKELWRPNLLPRTNEMDKRYKNPDSDPRGVWTSGDLSVKTYSAECDYPIITPSGRVVNPPSGYCWRVNKNKLQEMIADNRIWFGKNGNNVPRIKRFLSEVQQGIVSRTIWYRAEVGDTQEGTKDLKDIFDGKGVFTNPKPIRLMKKIIQLASQPDSTIIDFFAGSGTIGQAVLEQNSEDSGGRNFILITNNENNICRGVTYERIRRAIKKENYKASLKYYQIDYVNTEGKVYYEYADELLKHIKELVQLENRIDIDENKGYSIVLTDEEMESFLKSDFYSSKKYKKLYLGHDILLDSKDEIKLKRAGIELIPIPDYYYSD